MPVHAAQAGTVTFVAGSPVSGRQRSCTARRRTTYQPVTAAVAVASGRPGAVIGHLAFAGSHCLPRTCLHWGLIAGDRYLDPLVLVGAEPQPVRTHGALPGRPGIPVIPQARASWRSWVGTVPGSRFSG